MGWRLLRCASPATTKARAGSGTARTAPVAPASDVTASSLRSRGGSEPRLTLTPPRLPARRPQAARYGFRFSGEFARTIPAKSLEKRDASSCAEMKYHERLRKGSGARLKPARPLHQEATGRAGDHAEPNRVRPDHRPVGARPAPRVRARRHTGNTGSRRVGLLSVGGWVRVAPERRGAMGCSCAATTTTGDLGRGDHRPRLHEVIVHRTDRLDRVDRTTIDGIPTTALTRTVLDLGAVAQPWDVELA